MDSSDEPALKDVRLEFRAGIMFVDGTRVTPDPRKGLVRIGRRLWGSNEFIHFQWLDRSSEIIELVDEPSGRVYVLKFHTDNDRKFFFWMQEPRDNNDTLVCKFVNCYLKLFPDELIAEDPEAHPEDPGESIAYLACASKFGAQETPNSSFYLDSDIVLADILDPELLGPVIHELSLHQELAPYLPEGTQTPEDLMELLQCPPFQKQLESITIMLWFGELDVRDYGIDLEKFMNTVPSFLELLEDLVSGESESRQSSEHDTGSSDSWHGGDATGEGK